MVIIYVEVDTLVALKSRNCYECALFVSSAVLKQKSMKCIGMIEEQPVSDVHLQMRTWGDGDEIRKWSKINKVLIKTTNQGSVPPACKATRKH